MINEYAEEYGDRTEEKVSLIKRKWPNDIPDVEVNVDSEPENHLIVYQISYEIDGDVYGKEITEDVDDLLTPEEFSIAIEPTIETFSEKYHEIIANE